MARSVMDVQIGIVLKVHFAHVANVAEIQMLLFVVFDRHLGRIETTLETKMAEYEKQNRNRFKLNCVSPHTLNMCRCSPVPC